MPHSPLKTPLPIAHFILWNMQQSTFESKVIRPLNWWTPVVREALDNYFKRETLNREHSDLWQKWYGYYSQTKFWFRKAWPDQKTKITKLHSFCLFLSKNGHIIIEPPGKLRSNGPDFISFYLPNYSTMTDNSKPVKPSPSVQDHDRMNSSIAEQDMAAISQTHSPGIEEIYLSDEQKPNSLAQQMTHALRQQAIIECLYDFDKMHQQPPVLNEFRN